MEDALGYINVLVQGYIPRLLGCINYKPKILTYILYKVNPPVYSKTPRYTNPPDTFSLLSKKLTKNLQKLNKSIL